MPISILSPVIVLDISNDLRRLEATGVFFRAVAKKQDGSPLKELFLPHRDLGLYPNSDFVFIHSMRHTGPQLVCHHVSNWAAFKELFDCLNPRGGRFWLTLVAAVSIPGIYGAVHVIPSLISSSLFSTGAELLLWELSWAILLPFIVISLVGGVAYALFLGSHRLQLLYTSYQIRPELEAWYSRYIWSQTWNILARSAVCGFLCLSLAGRAFLVVESFISSR